MAETLGSKGGHTGGVVGNGAALGFWFGLSAQKLQFEGPVSGGGNGDCANEP